MGLHDAFVSPFSWRYGSPAMRAVWSEVHKRRLWRQIWVALAEVQAEIGLVRPEQAADLRAHVDEVDIDAALALEAELHHDLMAEVHAWARVCPVGGGIIHLGATSMDIEDNADALRLRASLDLVRERVVAVLRALADRVEAHADDVTMAFTHLQPAEPTTIGYRLAQYAQDLMGDLDELDDVRRTLRGKGFKGAVGTLASYTQLLHGTGVSAADFEGRVMARLDLPAFPVTTQTAPRKQELRVLHALSGIAQTLYRFAADLRILQSPVIGEWAEPFGKRQIGSSAMPFKRNPIHAENMDSLARFVASLPRIAWDNAAHSYLERTLDDSANRRVVLPEAFLAVDELLSRAHRLVTGLVVDLGASARLLASYGPFAATERVLMEVARRGGDRQEVHEVLREQAMAAWAAIKAGAPNPLIDALSADPRLLAWATADELRGWMDASAHVGDAPQRCRDLAAAIRERAS